MNQLAHGGRNVAEYPSQYESDLIVADGSQLKLRPIRGNDTQAWAAFIERPSTQSKYLRFHHIVKRMSMEDARRFCCVDCKDSFALVAEILLHGRSDIIAIGRYNRLDRSNSAEFAVVVEDAYQRKGIGTSIMRCLVRIGYDNGITAFESEVLQENHEMITLLKNLGFRVSVRLEAGVYHDLSH